MSAAVMNSTVYDFSDLYKEPRCNYSGHGMSSSSSTTSSSSVSSSSSSSSSGKSGVSRRSSNPLASASLLDAASQHRKLDRSQSEPAAPVNTSRYKTELCRPYEESGVCKYGDKCQFAHGARELRSLARHPKYKTELCRTFHTIGFCPYGPRCHFIHNAEEARPKSASSAADVFAFSFPSPLLTPTPPPSPPPASPDARLPVFNRLAGLSELLA